MLERAGANKFKLGQVFEYRADSVYQVFQIRFHLSRRYIAFRLSDILNQVPFIAQLHSIPFIRYFTSDSIYQAFQGIFHLSGRYIASDSVYLVFHVRFRLSDILKHIPFIGQIYSIRFRLSGILIRIPFIRRFKANSIYRADT